MGKSNSNLLDKKGKWIESSDYDALLKYNGKIMIGFLSYSHYNVTGLMDKDVKPFVSMRGYACSHYRELTVDEMKSVVGYND